MLHNDNVLISVGHLDHSKTFSFGFSHF